MWVQHVILLYIFLGLFTQINYLALDDAVLINNKTLYLKFM